MCRFFPQPVLARFTIYRSNSSEIFKFFNVILMVYISACCGGIDNIFSLLISACYGGNVLHAQKQALCTSN